MNCQRETSRAVNDLSSRGFVELGSRIRLWQALEADFPNDWMERRAALGLIVARETLECWHNCTSSFVSTFQFLPDSMLDAGQKQLLKANERVDVCEEFERQLEEYSESCGLSPPPELEGVPWIFNVPFACFAALFQVNCLNHCWGSEDSVDGESDQCDPHFASCLTLAGEDSSNDHTGYWRHWLLDLFPRIQSDTWLCEFE